MANCTNCGTKLQDGAKFCPSCGTAVAEKPAKITNCTNCGAKLQDGAKFCPSCGTSVEGKSAPQTGELQADPNDAEQNKGMAVVAYLIFFVPLITGDHKKSPFVKYHTNQGTILFIAIVALWIVYSILAAILISTYSFALIRLVGILTPLLWICTLALVVLGIVNAVQGRMKPLPLIGKFVIIK